MILNSSNLISKTHIACPDCGSSDALTVYQDGHSFCYACSKYRKDVQIEESNVVEISKSSQQHQKIMMLPTVFKGLPDRQIGAQAQTKYQVTRLEAPDGVWHFYPRFDKAGHHVGNKIRKPNKEFTWEGDYKAATLFGQQLFPSGSSQSITITEGECDAMAAYEMAGCKYPVVSVGSAMTAVKDCTQNFEYLNSFDHIVLCFDKDEPHVGPDGRVRYPGQDAAVAVASLFPIGKVRIMTPQEHKDANEYLIAGKSVQFMKEWWKAPRYTPSGLKLGSDMWEEISKPKNYDTVPYPWDSLNEKTYGLRLSEFVIVTGNTGDGKTQILKEIVHYIRSQKEDRGIGVLFLEEPNSDTALGLMSIQANKPLHLPDVREQIKEEDLRKWYDESVNTDKLVIWDHFGSNTIDEVLSKIRHMHNLGCKYIILDHLSIVVSDQNGDERKQLDEIATKLKMMCMELNVCVLAVIHQNRQGEIRGTAGVEQLANIVIKITRNKEDSDDWRRNVVKLTVQKNRFCGRTGPASWLFYEPTTGRLSELSPEEVKQYEAGLGDTKAQEAKWS